MQQRSPRRKFSGVVHANQAVSSLLVSGDCILKETKHYGHCVVIVSAKLTRLRRVRCLCKEPTCERVCTHSVPEVMFESVKSPTLPAVAGEG